MFQISFLFPSFLNKVKIRLRGGDVMTDKDFS